MFITSGQVRYTCGVRNKYNCQHGPNKTRISCVNCQTTHTSTVRSMTIRLYLTTSFYSLNSRGRSVSFQPAAAFLFAFYPFDSPPPLCLYKMSKKSRLHVQYQYQYQHQYHGTILLRVDGHILISFSRLSNFSLLYSDRYRCYIPRIYLLTHSILTP